MNYVPHVKCEMAKVPDPVYIHTLPCIDGKLSILESMRLHSHAPLLATVLSAYVIVYKHTLMLLHGDNYTLS